MRKTLLEEVPGNSSSFRDRRKASGFLIDAMIPSNQSFNSEFVTFFSNLLKTTNKQADNSTLLTGLAKTELNFREQNLVTGCTLPEKKSLYYTCASSSRMVQPNWEFSQVSKTWTCLYWLKENGQTKHCNCSKICLYKNLVQPSTKNPKPKP